MKRSHLLTAAAGALATMASPAYALNVGEARVLSFTDQPLRVLIPIKAQGWEWRAMWASAQTYQRGLGLTATLYKPTGERNEGFIEIRSKAPITEPIVDLQITFETGHRTTVHRTPILIDVQHQTVSVEDQKAISQNPLAPYEGNALNVPSQSTYGTPVAAGAFVDQAMNQVIPQVATPIGNEQLPEVQAIVTPANEHIRASSYQPPPPFPPASARASQPIDIPAPPALNVAKIVERQSSGLTGPAHASYTVKPGDGLYQIASKRKPALWSVDETMAHIFKNNRAAFSGAAYNSMKAGAILTFHWENEQVDITEQRGTAFPELKSAETYAEPKAQRYDARQNTTFTEEDAREAVMRHRTMKLQQELQSLQKNRGR